MLLRDEIINPTEAKWRAKAGYRGVPVHDETGQLVAVWNYMYHGWCGSVGRWTIGSVDLVREDGVILDEEAVVYLAGVPHKLRKPGRRYADGTEVYVPTLIKTEVAQ